MKTMYVDEQLGVRIVREEPVAKDPNELVVVQVKDEQRGWLDFYQVKWPDLAHGRVSAKTLGASAVDHARMIRAVAMAAATFERESIRDLYAASHNMDGSRR